MAFGLVVEHPRYHVNIGTLLRSAYNFNAAFLATIGRRYNCQASDTTDAWRHIPLLHFLTWEEYRCYAPFGWQPVAVELREDAESLPRFVHPKSAMYLLGPENGSLSQEAIRMCKYKIVIPSRHCLNVATAGAIVMYDRISKEILRC